MAAGKGSYLPFATGMFIVSYSANIDSSDEDKCDTWEQTRSEGKVSSDEKHRDTDPVAIVLPNLVEGPAESKGRRTGYL